MKRSIMPMSLDEMLSSLQSYYGGTYDATHLAVFFDEYDGLSPLYLGCVYHVVTRRYSMTWGKLPDVARIAEYSAEIEADYQMAKGALPRLPEPQATEAERKAMADKLEELVAKLSQGKKYPPLAKGSDQG